MIRRRHSLAAFGLVALILAAYSDSFSGPFVSDDLDAIANNPSIRSLWPLTRALAPPHDAGETVGGRPLLNLSFALNYAAGGLDPGGFHAVNLLIHVVAALLLFGIVRRSLSRWSAGGDIPATPFAFAVAALWAVHPLQTESVTYVVQRAESLMGMFYLLTLYCFIRYSDETLTRSAPNQRGETLASVRSGTRKRFVSYWAAGSVTFCLLGMATKEVMVSAPLLVLLYDRTFLSGSLRQAWQRHRGVYAGLAGGWLLLAWLVLATGNRGGSMGVGVGVAWGPYLLTQVAAIGHYLRLSIWPHPLIFDYGAQWSPDWRLLAADGAVIAGLAVLTVAGLFRSSWLGLLGAWFFAILAPTSLVPANRFTLAEHRMYLASIPVLAAVVAGIWRGAARSQFRRLGWFGAAIIVLTAAEAAATYSRNRDYRSDLVLWSDTVAKLPTNPNSRDQFGSALSRRRRSGEAIAQFEEAIRLNPGFAQAHFNLGNELNRAGRAAAAIAQYQEAVRLEPWFADARDNLANALADSGRMEEAFSQYAESLRLRPEFPEAHSNYGNALFRAGRWTEAIEQYREALRLDPDLVLAHYNLGNALYRLGRFSEAIEEYGRALAIDPGYAPAHHNLGAALSAVGREREAAEQLAEAARLQAVPAPP